MKKNTNEISLLEDFIKSKEHYKSNLSEILYFWRHFELVKPSYLEVYPIGFIKNNKDLDYIYNYWDKTIVWWEIGSQWRYQVDFISKDGRNSCTLHKVSIEDFIRMVIAWKIILWE